MKTDSPFKRKSSIVVARDRKDLRVTQKSVQNRRCRRYVAKQFAPIRSRTIRGHRRAAGFVAADHGLEQELATSLWQPCRDSDRYRVPRRSQSSTNVDAPLRASRLQHHALNEIALQHCGAIALASASALPFLVWGGRPKVVVTTTLTKIPGRTFRGKGVANSSNRQDLRQWS